MVLRLLALQIVSPAVSLIGCEDADLTDVKMASVMKSVARHPAASLAAIQRPDWGGNPYRTMAKTEVINGYDVLTGPQGAHDFVPSTRKHV